MAKKIEDLDANLTGENEKNNTSRSSWFKRIKKGIDTKTSEKKETPEGLWNKCPDCGLITVALELEENLHVCPKCNHHTIHLLPIFLVEILLFQEPFLLALVFF